uniref:Immunoglobulin domain-containing protein n=1 Tax=Hucho hucho TaxID=62062 RepID=A0A4W5MPE0_9TELE
MLRTMRSSSSLVTVCFCLTALCVVESAITKVTGAAGGQVTFVCSFIWAGTNYKYFCNGKCSCNSDILIQTVDSNKYMKTGRYSIDDRGDGDFTVTINNLKTSDSGTYWCGVNRFFKDSYQEVYLTVTDGNLTPNHILVCVLKSLTHSS